MLGISYLIIIVAGIVLSIIAFWFLAKTQKIEHLLAAGMIVFFIGMLLPAANIREMHGVKAILQGWGVFWILLSLFNLGKNKLLTKPKSKFDRRQGLQIPNKFQWEWYDTVFAMWFAGAFAATIYTGSLIPTLALGSLPLIGLGLSFVQKLKN